MSKYLSLPKVQSMLRRLYEVSGASAFFDAPDVRVASASDPWFLKYKTVIGEFHWTASEALHFDRPDAEAKSVISWVLPVKKSIRDENRAETERPAVSWAAMRSFGERANETIGEQFCLLLKHYGYAAISPHLEQTRQGYRVTDCNFCSHWSERHVGFVAGHGTFGLSAGLITRFGIAMRLGSVVTDLELPVSEREYGDDPWAWCTKCGACMKRCPAHAVGMTVAERDKASCAQYQAKRVLSNREEAYGWMNLNLGCGLCQTGVPCENRRPPMKGKRNEIQN